MRYSTPSRSTDRPGTDFRSRRSPVSRRRPRPEGYAGYGYGPRPTQTDDYNAYLDLSRFRHEAEMPQEPRSLRRLVLTTAMLLASCLAVLLVAEGNA